MIIATSNRGICRRITPMINDLFKITCCDTRFFIIKLLTIYRVYSLYNTKEVFFDECKNLSPKIPQITEYQLVSFPFYCDLILNKFNKKMKNTKKLDNNIIII